MSELLSVGISDATIARLKAELDPSQFKQACRSAVHRTMITGKALMAREVQKKLNVRIGDIKPVIKSRENAEDLNGTLTVTQKRIPLIDFIGTAPTRGGVRIKLYEDQPSMVLKHAFVAVLPGSGLQIDEREKYTGKGKKTKSGYVSRTPVETLKGISVLTTIGAEMATATGQRITRGLTETLEKNLLSQLDRFTK